MQEMKPIKEGKVLQRKVLSLHRCLNSGLI